VNAQATSWRDAHHRGAADHVTKVHTPSIAFSAWNFVSADANYRLGPAP
jgi:hypothetical protein